MYNRTKEVEISWYKLSLLNVRARIRLRFYIGTLSYWVILSELRSGWDKLSQTYSQLYFQIPFDDYIVKYGSRAVGTRNGKGVCR